MMMQLFIKIFKQSSSGISLHLLLNTGKDAFRKYLYRPAGINSIHKKNSNGILGGNYQELFNLDISFDEGWPDAIELETVPKILKNLELVNEPTGFESWMIVVKQGMKIIGSTGFKGVPNDEGSIDIGYGIISEAQKKGFAIEAVTALAKWAFSKPEVKMITARCVLNNVNSARLLGKMKFIEISRDDEMIYWKLVNQNPAPAFE